MTTPPLTHTVEGLMALVKSYGHIEILGAMGKVTALQRKKAWDDVWSYAIWLVDATAVDAAAEALKGKSAQPSAEPTANIVCGMCDCTQEQQNKCFVLHPATDDLVDRFALALKFKLFAAEVKYGYSDGWRDDAWMDECRVKLMEHVAKGDPRDVAAYCAFLWHHGESTASADEPGAKP